MRGTLRIEGVTLVSMYINEFRSAFYVGFK